MEELKFNFDRPQERELGLYDGPAGMAGVSKYMNMAFRQHKVYQDTKHESMKSETWEPGPKSRDSDKRGKSAEQQLDEARERIDRRLQQALRYLKRKGLRPAGIEGIQTVAEHTKSPLLANQYGMLIAALTAADQDPEHGPTLWAQTEKDVIPDDVYERAIEMVMLNTETDILYSKDMFGPVLEKHIGEIYQLAVLLHHVLNMVPDIQTLVDEHRQITSAVSRTGGDYKAARELLKTDVAEVQKEYDGKLQAAREEIAAQHEAEKQALRARIAELEKQLKPKDGKIKKLEAQLAKTEQRRCETQVELNRYSEAVNAKNRLISDLADQIPAVNHDRTMPQEGILFLGGTPALVSALKQDYPDWRYVYGRDKHCKDIARPRIIFLSPYDLDHAVSYRVQKLVGPDVPMVRISAVNPETAKYEMSLKYRNVVTDRKDA